MCHHDLGIYKGLGSALTLIHTPKTLPSISPSHGPLPLSHLTLYLKA
jgi:hypothetical protein